MIQFGWWMATILSLIDQQKRRVTHNIFVTVNTYIYIYVWYIYIYIYVWYIYIYVCVLSNNILYIYIYICLYHICQQDLSYMPTKLVSQNNLSIEASLTWHFFTAKRTPHWKMNFTVLECFGYTNSRYSILSCLWMFIDAYGTLDCCAEVHENVGRPTCSVSKSDHTTDKSVWLNYNQVGDFNPSENILVSWLGLFFPIYRKTWK